jgi:hypothetical protein
MAKKVVIDEASLMARMGLQQSPLSPPSSIKENEVIQKSEQKSEDDSSITTEIKPETPAKTVKHRKGSYEDLFLTKNTAKVKQSEQGVLRVSPEVHKRLTTSIFAAHGTSISLVDYISNVLINHLNEYSGDLRRYYNEREKEIAF